MISFLTSILLYKLGNPVLLTILKVTKVHLLSSIQISTFPLVSEVPKSNLRQNGPGVPEL